VSASAGILAELRKGLKTSATEITLAVAPLPDLLVQILLVQAARLIRFPNHFWLAGNFAREASTVKLLVSIPCRHGIGSMSKKQDRIDATLEIGGRARAPFFSRLRYSALDA
jgi:hypothetical protein